MRQIVLERPGVFADRSVPAPRRSEHEALVRVHRIGVCGTDFHAFAGRQPFITFPRVLGHEIACEVVEVPDNDRGIQAGDRCAVEPYLSCGGCRSCLLNRANCCEHLQVLGVHVDGAMQGLFAVPVEKLYPSALLAFDQLAIVETLGIGAHAVVRSGLAAGEDALVVGAGPIGLSVVQFARAQGAAVRMIEISDWRRSFAGRFGIDALPSWDGRTAAVVFDATGNAGSMSASVDYVAPAGRLVFVGLCRDPVPIDDPLFHRRELTLHASRNSSGQFARIIRMIEEGRIDTAPWITDRMPLAEVPREFDALRQRPTTMKAMIEIEDSDAV